MRPTAQARARATSVPCRRPDREDHVPTEDLYSQSFSRNLGVLTQAEQERLRTSCVAIAGLGGIGGQTLVLLARMGVGHVRIADFDTFEYPNINRQVGAAADTVGKLKAHVLAEEVRRINPAARVEVFDEGFTESTAAPLLDGADAAIDAIDFYAIETHLELHRAARRHGLYVLMGSPVGFSGCLQIFDPAGMSLEEYCAIRPEMPALEKQLRYACGLVPNLAHIDYFDVSAASSNTNFLQRKGPSLACACALASSLVAAETVLLLLGRRKPRCIPHTFQFDPYTYRYEKPIVEGGMSHYDAAAAIRRIPDRSSLVPQVLHWLYRKKQAQQARVNGADLYYQVEGGGETLLLVSPLGGDSSFWPRQIQPLSRSFRVISYDPRGSGESSACTATCSTREMAEDALALLAHLGVTRAHVVGLALGGLVAQEMALLEPGLVDRLVLVSTYARADAPLRAATERWRHVATTQGMEPLFDECLDSLFTPEYIACNYGELENLRTFYHLNLQRPDCFCHQCRAGITHDTRGRLGAIGAPTLVIHGERDSLVDLRLGAELAGGIPGARLLVIDGAPHFLPWENANRFNASLIEFLASSPAVSTVARGDMLPAG